MPGIQNDRLHGGNVSVNILKFKPVFKDYGMPLTCVVSHRHYSNNSLPLPTCGYERINVRFDPRMECAERQWIRQEDRKYSAKCNIFSYPSVTLKVVYTVDASHNQ